MSAPISQNQKWSIKGAFIVSILYIVYSIATVLILMFLDGGYPETAEICFQMFRGNRFLAYLQLDVLSVIIIPTYALLFYGIYAALDQPDSSIAKAALFLVLGGVIVFMGSVNLLSLVNLADKYNQSNSEAMKELYLAAGEGMLADDMWVNTGNMFRGILIETGALLFSWLMLKSPVFGKPLALLGLITHSFDIASLVIGLFFPLIKEIFTYVAGPLYLIWFILLAIRLGQLGFKDKDREKEKLEA